MPLLLVFLAMLLSLCRCEGLQRPDAPLDLSRWLVGAWQSECFALEYQSIRESWAFDEVSASQQIHSCRPESLTVGKEYDSWDIANDTLFFYSGVTTAFAKFRVVDTSGTPNDRFELQKHSRVSGTMWVPYKRL